MAEQTFGDPFEGLRRLRQVRDAGAGGSAPLPQRPQVNIAGVGGVVGGLAGGGTLSGSLQQMAQQAMGAHGWGPDQWGALNELVNRESSWNPTAQNPTSSAFGLFQFLDSTWGGVGAQKTSDPAAQIRAGLQYIANRYGSPAAALRWHDSHNWY